MNFRLLRYVFLLGFIFLKLTSSFASSEIASKPLDLHVSKSFLNDKDDHNKHFGFHRIQTSSQSNALFFEQLEENEDDEVKQSLTSEVVSVITQNNFSFFIPTLITDYLKPKLRSYPLGLRSEEALFIVFRLIRI